ncbi:hypothetical protein B0H14DRAFT_2681252 [Mycena olivaceomarginata]|nr:hypothetical protein B0H14DRAFT_2681252 [Mycena olivaceomarginata]
MFRKLKFSKSSASLKSTPALATSSPKSTQPAPNQLAVAWPHKRLQTGLKTASDSSLPSKRIVQKDGSPLAPSKPNGVPYAVRVPRGRRATISNGQPDILPTISRQKRPTPADIRPRKIVPYMPELYDEANPIRVTGRFYAWDDPSWLDYVPLPPPPRKHSDCGRIALKPKQGQGVCSMCSSLRGFSCGSTQCEEAPSLLPAPTKA